MKLSKLILLAVISVLAASSRGWGQVNSIQNSPHNLSAGGRGTIRASKLQETCVFCHTTHNSAPVKQLWNRTMPTGAYKIYSSTSLKSKPGQPTGSSKLCLSCHDGTIALGSVLSRPEGVAMRGGVTTLQGRTKLGTDLSADHPISFVYDNALVAQNPHLRPPKTLLGAVRLDSTGELQCTSCHDPHDNSRSNFLVMDNSHSQLCNTCHNTGTTTIAEHQDCANCHQPHNAPGGPHILKAANETQTCLLCHSGQSGAAQGKNIAADLGKPDHHDTNSPNDVANPIPNVANCVGCHAPHTMATGTALASTIAPGLGAIAGINAAGTQVQPAQFQYQVCFKCHADQAAQVHFISRQAVQTNLRMQLAQTAASFHPVEGAGRGMDVPSLAPGMTIASVINCDDCHNSDASTKSGGAGPNGVHGSANPGLLALRCDTADYSVENAAMYALCYKCHQRTSIIADPTLVPNQPFPLHLSHVVNDKAACTICHDSHGIAAAQGSTAHNSHLINFDTAIVLADPVTGKLEYDMTGMRQGMCYLSCHGVAHSPMTYGPGAQPQFRRPVRQGGAPPRPTPTPAPIPPPRH